MHCRDEGFRIPSKNCKFRMNPHGLRFPQEAYFKPRSGYAGQAGKYRVQGDILLTGFLEAAEPVPKGRPTVQPRTILPKMRALAATPPRNASPKRRLSLIEFKG